VLFTSPESAATVISRIGVRVIGFADGTKATGLSGPVP
jgi:hypothetical protein